MKVRYELYAQNPDLVDDQKISMHVFCLLFGIFSPLVIYFFFATVIDVKIAP